MKETQVTIFKKAEKQNAEAALEVFCNKRCSKKFRKFTGKHLCQGLLFHQVVGLRLATLLKKRS